MPRLVRTRTEAVKVFIADDSNLVVDRLTALLSKMEGVAVVGCAADAPRAIQAIRELSPDAVILDLHMPTAGGITVLEAVKVERPWVKVLILTSFASPWSRARCLRAGADFFLDKAEIEKIPELLVELKEAALRTLEDAARSRSKNLRTKREPPR